MFTRRIMSFPGHGSTNPFAELDRMRRQMDALSGMFYRGMPEQRAQSAGVFPLLNLTESQNNYYIRAELPGMKAEDLGIQIVDKTLTISGERKISEEGEKIRYHRRERDAGKFSRAISLPGDIDNSKIEARMQDGLLMVTVPKAEAAKPRQITIR